jgi:hypothetical protein
MDFTRSAFLAAIGAFVLASAAVGCAAPNDDEPIGSQGAAYSGNGGAAPAMTDIERPSFAPEGFYPENNVGGYYGPCGPLSATWLMTWYAGKGPGGTGTNQGAYDRVSDFAQGDRVLPGSSPSGLAYAINRVLERSAFAGLARSKTDASIEEIRRLVSERRPVVTLIQWKNEDNNFVTMHYVTIFGYRRAGDSFVYTLHDNGSFREIEESALETARDTSFYHRAIVWIDRSTGVTLPSEP